MSGNIDRRIVEMRFDNKDFEKNVGQTLISLETLQKALKMSEGQQGLEKTKKGLFNLGKAVKSVDTAGMASNVEQISNRFSTLGIIGASALQTIGQHIAEVGFALKNKLLAPLEYIKTGGLMRALNLEQANFQIKGLGIEKNDTASYYTEVMDAVLGTAYSYDVAAKAASQLAASNVGVIEKEKTLLNGTKTTAKYFSGEMTDAILGIAGVAAMTGSSFEDISQVFTRVAGQGRVMSNDLNSISARGLNAAATLANYLHVTEAEVRDMVTKGQIDFDTFSKAMTEAFGSHAKAATQTFTGALEDVKAALARIGADFYGPYLTAARDILNSFTPIVDMVHDKIQPALDFAGETMLKYSKKATGFLDTISISGSTLTNKLGKVPPAVDIVRKGYSALIDETAELGEVSVAVYSTLADKLGVTGDKAKQMAKTGKVSFATWMETIREVSARGGEYSTAMAKYLSDLNPVLARYENIADNLGITNKAVAAGFEKFAKVMGVSSDEIYKAVGEKLGKTVDEVKTSLHDGTFSLTDFRKALEALKTEGAISPEKFSSVMDFVDNMIIDLPKLQGAIAKFGTHFGKYFTDILNAGKDVAKLFRDAFKGIIDVISGGGGESALFSIAKTIAAITAALARGISKAIEFGRTSGLFKKLHDILLGINNLIVGFIESLWSYSSSIGSIFSNLLGILSTVGSKISELFSSINIQPLGILKSVANGIGYLLGVIAKAVSQLDFSGIGGLLFGGSGFIAFTKLSNLIDQMTSKVEKVKNSGKLLDNIKEVLKGLGETLEEFQNAIKAQQLKTIAIAIGILAASCLVLSGIPADKLVASVVAIGIMAQELVLAANKLNAGRIRGLLTLAASLLLLSFAVKQLGNMDMASLAKGLLAVAAALQIFGKFAKAMEKSGDIRSIARSLIPLAIGLALLAIPIKVLGSMEFEELAQGLISIGLALMAFGKFAKVLSKALTASDVKNLSKISGSLILIGIGLLALTAPIAILGHMDSNKMAQGLLGIAGALAVIGAFCVAMDRLKVGGAEMLKVAASLTIMGVAITLIASALGIMGSINAGQGLSTLFGSLLILGLAVKGFQGSLGGAAAMVVVAAALALMAPSIAMLAALPIEKVLEGLLGLAVTFGVLAGAAALLSLAWPTMAIGTAILLGFGVAVLAVGAGILALGTGMALLAEAFRNGTDAIIQGLTALAAMLPTVTGYLWDFIKGMVEGFIENAPLIIEALNVLIDSLLTSLLVNIPKIAEVGLQLIVALLQAINSKIGDITNIAINIVINFLDALGSRAGDLENAGFNMLINFFNGTANAIAQNGPVLIASIENVMLSVIEVIAGEIPIFGDYAAEAISNYRQGLVDGQDGVASAADGVSNASKIKPQDQSGSGRKTANTFASGESSGQSKTRAAAAANAKAAEIKVPSQYGHGQQVVQGLISGLSSMLGSLRSMASRIASVVDSIIRKKNQIRSPSKRLAQTGRYMMQGLIAGLDSLTPEYQNRADNIATMMIESTNKAANAMSSFVSPMNLSGAIAQSTDVNLRMNDIKRENDRLASGINKLNSTLSSMTETMNSRSLNNYITIDGAGDPEGFADGLIRSFRLNARTV